MAIVFHVEHRPPSGSVLVSMQIDDGLENVEIMTISSFRLFCQEVDKGVVDLGGYRLDMSSVSKRTRRGILQYFRSVLSSFDSQ
jgi:hypothetical protein